MRLAQCPRLRVEKKAANFDLKRGGVHFIEW